jgi:mono/diheme cytochrome c family protein
LGFLLLAAGAAILYAQSAYRKVWDIPLPEIRATTDSAAIARGRYLVYGPAHCADCHVPDAARSRLYLGEEVPLTGGTGEVTYLGSWTAPNLTSDSVTGIGGVSDGMLARHFRHGVSREGRIALPFTESFANLAESDLVAILSFLRSLPAQPGVGPEAKVNTLGKVTLAYFIKPYGPKSPPPDSLPPEPTARYGDYVANTMGRCEACHTPRSLKTGEFLGPPFSGGLPFLSRERPGMMYVSPNLTPDSATGHMARWTEEFFLARFRAGLVIPDSPMPWGPYSRMTDGDLRALYRYLHSLAPVRRDNGPIVQPEKGQAVGG